MPGHVDQQRDVAVRVRREDVVAPQAGQPGDRVGPGIEPMPGTVQVIDLRLGQPVDAETLEQRKQALVVQVVELASIDGW
jgi:hypothetical protein